MGKVKAPLNNDGRLAAALEVVRILGFPVFPCHYIVDHHCSCAKGRKTDKDGNPECISGKHPATTNGFKAASTDESTIRRMWTHKQFNIGLATGHAWPGATGEHKYLAVPDVDIAEGKVGKESLAALVKKYGMLPETLRARTGSGGTHYYFLTRRPLKSFKAEDAKAKHPLGLNIDLRATGGYVLTAGSNHLSSGTYAFENPGTPIAPMPEWMEALLEHDRESKRPDVEVTVEDMQAVIPPEGLPFMPTDEELQTALDAISAELINEYDPGSEHPGCWWEIGAALRTLSEFQNDNRKYFPIWKEWSRRAPNLKLTTPERSASGKPIWRNSGGTSNLITTSGRRSPTTPDRAGSISCQSECYKPSAIKLRRKESSLTRQIRCSQLRSANVWKNGTREAHQSSSDSETKSRGLFERRAVDSARNTSVKFNRC